MQVIVYTSYTMRYLPRNTLLLLNAVLWHKKLRLFARYVQSFTFFHRYYNQRLLFSSGCSSKLWVSILIKFQGLIKLGIICMIMRETLPHSPRDPAASLPTLVLGQTRPYRHPKNPPSSQDNLSEDGLSRTWTNPSETFSNVFRSLIQGLNTRLHDHDGTTEKVAHQWCGIKPSCVYTDLYNMKRRQNTKT